MLTTVKGDNLFMIVTKIVTFIGNVPNEDFPLENYHHIIFENK